jgi:hypothetical protein
MMRAKAPTEKEINQIHVKFPPGTIFTTNFEIDILYRKKPLGFIISHSIIPSHSSKFGFVPYSWRTTLLVDGRVITVNDCVQLLSNCISLE